MNIAMLSYHTCPLATLGGKDTGGMNVYVASSPATWGALGVHVDVFTRSQDEHVPHVLHDLGYGNRVVHIPAGPEYPLPKPGTGNAHPAVCQRHPGILPPKKGLHYDLIHSHYWMSGVAAEQLAAQLAGADRADVPHAGDDEEPHRAVTPEEMEGEYRMEGEQQVLQNWLTASSAATLAEQSQLQFLYQRRC